MSNLDFDLSKAVFMNVDDLSQVNLTEGARHHRPSDGNTLSVETQSGRENPVVRDSNGIQLKSYRLTAIDAEGAKVCWVCFQPVDGPYTCFRAPCGSVVVEPM